MLNTKGADTEGSNSPCGYQVSVLFERQPLDHQKYSPLVHVTVLQMVRVLYDFCKIRLDAVLVGQKVLE